MILTPNQRYQGGQSDSKSISDTSIYYKIYAIQSVTI